MFNESIRYRYEYVLAYEFVCLPAARICWIAFLIFYFFLLHILYLFLGVFCTISWETRALFFVCVSFCSVAALYSPIRLDLLTRSKWVKVIN